MIQFDGHSATVCSLAFSPDSSLLAAGAKDGWVRVWDFAGDVLHAEGLSDATPRHALVWTTTGEWIRYPGSNGLRSLGPFPPRGQKFGLNYPKFQFDGVTALTHLNESLLVVGTGRRNEPGPGTLNLWDALQEKPKPVPHAIRGANGVRAIAGHPPTKRLHWIAGLPNTPACVWRSWCITSPNATDTKLNKPAAAITVSPDGETVAIASDWLVRVFTADGKPRTELAGHKGQVSGVGFVNSGRTVVSASWDETVRMWDVATGKETARFPLGIGKLTALTVSPDGTRIAVGGTDGPIVLIDAE